MNRFPFALALVIASCARVPSPDPGLDSIAPLQPTAPAVMRGDAPAQPAPPLASSAPTTDAVPPRAPALPHPWLDDAGAPASVDALVDRFAAPPGFTRVALPAASFGEWLRRLPLAAPGTPVTSHRGAIILRPEHANLAAVVAIDVGAQDLQQCADSILRLHAEWLWAQGRRDIAYRAASGAAMPFSRWAQGERMIPRGQGFEWGPASRADASRASFRRYLDAVFAFANTGSLARDTERVALDDLRPGDFVVQAGAPGHAVLVLDLATAPGGRRAILLGQGFMPAQSFHVLRPSGQESPWFVIEPGSIALDTPFWPAFPWKALRRFPGT